MLKAEHACEGLALSREVGDRGTATVCLACLGNVASDEGDYERAKRFVEEGLSLCAGLENKYLATISLSDLGELARLQSDYERAIVLHKQALTMAKEGGYSWTANVLRHLGMDYLRQGDYGCATEHYKESLVLCKTTRNKWIPVECLKGLGDIACVE